MPTGRPSIRRERRHNVARPARAQLEQRARVDDPGERVAHVVGRASARTAPRSPGRRSPGRRARRAATPRSRKTAGTTAAREPDAAALSSSRSTRWQTPLRSWTRGPPSAAASISSPSASRTTPGPVRNIAASSVIMIRSVSAGEYAPPPADAPETTEICGTTPVSADRVAEDPPVAGQRGRALPASARRRTRRTRRPGSGRARPSAARG